MQLQGDQSFSGDRIHSVLQQVLYHPLHQRRIQHHGALYSLQTVIFYRDTSGYTRTHVGDSILNDRNKIFGL